MFKCVSVECPRKLNLSERDRLVIIDEQGKRFLCAGLFGSEKDILDKATQHGVAFVFINNNFYLPLQFLCTTFPERLQQLSELLQEIESQCDCVKPDMRIDSAS
jgi:hypothetical protein